MYIRRAQPHIRPAKELPSFPRSGWIAIQAGGIKPVEITCAPPIQACRCPQMNPVLTPVPAFHIHMKQIITHPIRCRGTHSNLSFGSCYCGHEISLIAKGKQKLPRIIKHICQGISAFFRHADIPLRINAHKQLPFNGRRG